MVYILTVFCCGQQQLVAQFLSAEHAFVQAQLHADMTGKLVQVDRVHATTIITSLEGLDLNLDTYCGYFFPVHKQFRLFVGWERTPFACGAYKSVQTALAHLRKSCYTEARIYDSYNSTWLCYRKENGRFRRIETRYKGSF